MDVSGRKNTTNKDIGMLCYLCSKKAFWHCRNCNIHLCDTCAETNRTGRHSSSHTMSRSPSANAEDPLPACTKHAKEEVKFFCRSHEMIGCTACMIRHNECQTDYIPDISEQFLKGEDFFHYKVVVEELKTRFAEGLKKVKENECKVEEACGRAMEAIKSIKKEIMDYLDKFEIELQKEVTSFKKTNKDHLMRIESNLEELRNETLKTEDSVDQLERENKYNALFLEFKRAEKFMFDCQEKLYEISTRNSVKDLIFHPSNELKPFICKEKLFGSIKEIITKEGPLNTPEELEKQTIGTINLLSKDDKKSCHASGLTFLTNDLLAVADKTNHKIKVVDVSHDKIVSEKTLTSDPEDLTAIPPEKMAVVVSKENNIQILKNYNALTVSETFRINRKCLGITYDDGKLIVIYSSNSKPRIEILSLSGEVLSKFNTSESSRFALKELAAIDLSPDHHQMYIAGINKAIVRLSKLGSVTGSNDQHKYTGVAVSIWGAVYASSKEESIIVQLTDDLSESETVLTETNGIRSPIALAICKARNMMYVSSGSSDTVDSNRLLVFKIKLESNDAVLYSRQQID